MKRFQGRVVVVTGAGSGIGRQIAADLHAEGATVCLLGRRADMLEDTRRTLAASGDQRTIHTFACDVSSPAMTADVFARLKQQGDLVSALVNSAGVNPSRNTVTDTSEDDWNHTLAVNLTGAFNCSKAAIPHMRESGGGSIVNIASIAGILALRKRASYMASKWGLVGLSKSMAVDYAPENIRVNTVCPGYVETPLTRPFLERLTKDEYSDLVATHALRRLGTPGDVSAAVLFLLSDQASWITGVDLPVDGGCSL